MNYSKSESVKKHYKTGDKVRVIKTFYPLPTNIIGKESTIIVDDSIYLTDLKIYINHHCIEPIDANPSQINLNDIIYQPEIISIKHIELNKPKTNKSRILTENWIKKILNKIKSLKF